MNYSEFFDANPVILDDLGNPLQGRVQFYDGGTITPKSIYEDEVGTLAQNPQYTDSTGKLENQIFYSEGSYTLYFQRYLGTSAGNMMSAPDTDFYTFKVENVEGGASQTSASNYNSTTIDNIEALRNVDPTQFQTAIVLGYYSSSADQIPSRTYYWNRTSLASDNFGTIIKPISLTTGRWMMAEPEEMNVKYFGIFPDGTTRNSNLTALIAWMDSAGATCKTIRFPSGDYSFVPGTFYFDSKIILEQSVRFLNTNTASTLNITINNDYEILTSTQLLIPNSNTFINFTDVGPNSLEKVVNSAWFGNDDRALYLMSTCVNNEIPIQITNAITTVSGTNDFYNDIIFNSGSITIQGGIVRFFNNEVTNIGSTPGLISNDIINYDYEQFRFNNSKVYSNVFGSSDFQQKLSCQTFSNNSEFVFNSSITFSDTFTDNDGFKFEFESGSISTSTAEKYATFNTFKSNDEYIFIDDSYVVLKNRINKIINFLPLNATSTQQESAFYSALRSVLIAGGVLDLCNKAITIASSHTILANGSASFSTIQNGTIVTSITNPLIIINNIFNYIKFQNVVLTTQSSSDIVFLISTGLIQKLILENVIVYGGSNGLPLVGTANGGMIQEFEVYGSDISNSYLLNETLNGINQINIHNNDNLNCSLVARWSQPQISDNYIAGAYLKLWDVKCIDSGMIHDNRFYQCDLYLTDNAGYIDHNVVGNQFESTDAKWSRIILNALTANTIVDGLLIKDNNFIGSLSNPTQMILAQGSYQTSANMHSMLVADNQGYENCLCQTTKGIEHLSFLQGTIELYNSTPQGFLRFVLIPFTSNMLVLPSDTATCIGTGNMSTGGDFATQSWLFFGLAPYSSGLPQTGITVFLKRDYTYDTIDNNNPSQVITLDLNYQLYPMTY